MRILSLFFFALAVIIVGAAYMAFVSFSEHREYSRMSLDYYLLTPQEMSALSELCMDRPLFIYSSADGPKPTIVTMNCKIVREKLENYMKSNNFQLDNADLYKKGDTEIQVTMNPLTQNATSIVLIEQP